MGSCSQLSRQSRVGHKRIRHMEYGTCPTEEGLQGALHGFNIVTVYY
jgi:hypothetical protein